MSNRSVAKSNVMGNNNLLRMATYRGKSAPRPLLLAVASRSVTSADQWEVDTHVLFGVGWKRMLICVHDHSDMVERVGIDWFGGL